MKDALRMTKDDTRPCLIMYERGGGVAEKGFFHLWRSGKDICGKKTLYAMVELGSGRIICIEHDRIVFIDRDPSEFEVPDKFKDL